MRYQLELRHLRYFQVVAEELHFRRAAARLYISQPGLSRQIKELENHIGAQLFERHNRKVQLTKAGAYLKQELPRHLNAIDHAVQHAKHLQDGLQGDLKLGYVGSAMQQIIPDLLLTFRKDYPSVHFTLKEMENQAQIEGVLTRDLDMGFVRLSAIPQELESQVLLREPFCLVLPSDHHLNHNTFKDMSQLREESFILFDSQYSPSYFENVMQIFGDSGYTPKVSHNTIHSDSIYKLVQNHFGISIIPQSLRIDDIKGVKFITLENIAQRTVLLAVWDPTNRNPMLEVILKMIVSD
ncbi:MAG: DNA-binding transcriptional LysR family regulator [Arcticibacterium sp.]|jgi:DNA-binding transcriptional LysR family regulator